jgi:hypothetical protein
MKTGWTLAVLLVLAPEVSGYSVLTHEAIVDSLWVDGITPLIKKRFPDVTEEQLIKAHAYSYGGTVIQDMGYFPLGSKLFSDLAHYVRSGDFVMALLRNAQTVDEYAFALGALAHYTSDTIGHPEAINRAVPILYPKLRKKYGPVVTYEEDPSKHLKTEFGFDVLEIAKGRYAPKEYHDFVGFDVSKPVLERAFVDTYSLELKDIFKSVDLALGTYRKAVAGLIPEMTRVAWREKSKEIQKSQPGITKRKFLYNLSKSSYEKEWGKTYERPGLGTRILSFLFKIIPKFGPLRALSFRVPDPQSEKLFMASFNDTLARYKEYLRQEGTESGVKLEDRNLDTGDVPKRGTYRKQDCAYELLLEKLTERKREINPGLRAAILNYYGQTGEPKSEKARRELASLRQ